jgi:hypothetical protein
MGGAIGEGENHFILDIGWCAGNWQGSFPRTVKGWCACAALSIIRARSLRPSSALNAKKWPQRSGQTPKERREHE